MPGTYQGNGVGLAKSPSPAFGPGVKPTSVTITDGVDAVSAASVLEQEQVPADFIAGIQASARLFPPQLATGAVGFTAIAHVVGMDTGTISVTANVANPGIATGLNFVIKIIASGNTGVATFQSSTDGGNTYGATQTTSASMTDATTGVAIAFTGHFTAGDLYQWLSAFSPVLLTADAGGNVRGVHDHIGFRTWAHNVSETENWPASVSQTTTVNPVVNNPRWQWIAGSSATLGNDAGLIASSAAGPGVAVKTGGSTTKGILSSAIACIRMQTNCSLVLEFDFGLSSINGTCGTSYLGIVNAADPTLVGSNSSVMFTTANGGHYFWQTVNAGTNTTGDTTIVPTVSTGPNVRAKIEWHGSASPYGSRANFFLNEQLVGVSTTTLPALPGVYYLTFGGIDAGTVQQVNLGGVFWTYNRWLSVAL